MKEKVTKTQSRKKDLFTIVLESIRSDFKVFGEKLEGLEKKIDKRFKQVDKKLEQVDRRLEQVDRRLEQVDKRFEQVDKRFDSVQSNFKTVFGYLSKIDDEIQAIKKALANKTETKTTLILEKRVSKLEKELGEIKSLLRAKELASR